MNLMKLHFKNARHTLAKLFQMVSFPVFFLSFSNSFVILVFLSRAPVYSLLLGMVGTQSLCGNNSWVRSNLAFWLLECVLVRRHEESLVVGASVADHDLGRVLVGHHHGRSRETTSVGQGVVGLKRLLNHASMQAGSHFEHLTTQAAIMKSISKQRALTERQKLSQRTS